MKRIISLILVLATVFGLTLSMSISTAALTAHLDGLQINSKVLRMSQDYAGATGITINAGDKIYIIGWVVFTASDGLKEIRYAIDGKEFACQDNYRDRPDVAAAGITVYNNGEHAGYGKDDDMMELTGIDGLSAGTYKLQLKAYSNGGVSTTFRTYTLTVKGTDTVQLDALQAGCGTIGGSEDLKNRERITLDQKTKLFIVGWAAFTGQDKLNRVVYSVNGDERECGDNYRDRPDVAAAGIPVADNGAHAGFGDNGSMFELTGVDSLPFGVYRIGITAVSDSGKRLEVASFILRVVSSGISLASDLGDVNDDGSVNNKDVVALFKKASGENMEINESHADVNFDGSINNKDVVALFKLVSEGGAPAEPDEFTGTPAYTVSGDSIIVDGVSYPNDQNMKNGVMYAMDDLGRELVLDSGSYSGDGTKNVGLFYFLWMGEHGDYGLFDITKILAAGGEAAKKASYSGWGPVGAMHYWGEPLYGYYYSSDTWVMRKHIEELTLANVDFLYIDATNGFPYLNNARALMKIMHEFNEQGYKAPKIVFYTHSSCSATVKQIYNGIYSNNYYPDTWFYLDGKPLIIAYQDECSSGLSSAAYNFFSYREPQWPNEAQKTNGWPWMDFNYPQRVFVNKQGKAEAMSVSVAQHSGTVRFSDSAIYGNRTNRGRSFSNEAINTDADATLYGYNFAEQFRYAINSNVPYILVTGWNEWVAQRQPTNNDTVIFVDTCSMEYSRDLEPMKGGYFDNYYMQLIEWVRRYKGSAPALVQNDRKPIDVNGSFDQWDDVLVTYTDPSGDTVNRNGGGFGSKTITNTTGANDIVASKVIYDTKNIYFYVETASDITPRGSGKSWMQLFINADQDGGTGYYGFDYIVNRAPSSDSVTTLEKCENNGASYAASGAEQIEYRSEGNKMMFKIPLSFIGINDYNDIMIAFKWVDANVTVTTMDQMYTDGDAAPIGRLCYTFENHR